MAIYKIVLKDTAKKNLSISADKITKDITSISFYNDLDNLKIHEPGESYIPKFELIAVVSNANIAYCIKINESIST